MTRKDYIAIARAIRVVVGVSADAKHTIAFNIAAVMAAENPRFDATKFLEACGV